MMAHIAEFVAWAMWRLWLPLLKLLVMAILWRLSLDAAATAASESAVSALMMAMPDSRRDVVSSQGPQSTSATGQAWWPPRAMVSEDTWASVRALADQLSEADAQRLGGQPAKMLWDRFSTIAMSAVVDVAMSLVRR